MSKFSKRRKTKKLLKKYFIQFLKDKGIEVKNCNSYWQVLQRLEEHLEIQPRTPCKSDEICIEHLIKIYTKLNGKEFSLNSITTKVQWQRRTRRKTSPGVKNLNDIDSEIPLEQRLRLFYESYEWRKLRYKVLLEYGRICMRCGSETRICVDHIKPIRKYWGLRLVFDNLQVLCEECNHGKGSWDESDWRPGKAIKKPNFPSDLREYLYEWEFWTGLDDELRRELISGVVSLLGEKA